MSNWRWPKRISDFERGNVVATNVFVLRLWHRDANALISRASIARNAFTFDGRRNLPLRDQRRNGAPALVSDMAWWTFGTYRGYDLPTDDQTAAELLPWSATFTGRLDSAEALYDSPKGGLVGFTTQVGRVPQHMLIFGVVGAGKSILLTDLWAQMRPQFWLHPGCRRRAIPWYNGANCGRSSYRDHARGMTTINYLDTCGLPLTSEHVGTAVALCLQMLRENIGNKVDQARISSFAKCSY